MEPATRMTLPAENKKAMVLGIPVDALDMETALSRIETMLAARHRGYVCFVGVHGIMEAQRDPSLAQVYAHATLRIPDGMPTVWMGWQQGLSTMRRVAGPDLMLEMFSRKQFAHHRHFLYGGKPGVAEELRHNLTHRYPWVEIVGTFTPPFRDLTLEEEDALASQVSAVRPDIIWVGISTPKQERFMMRMMPRLDCSLAFGVGAAFDFHTGRIKDCPQWVKSAGMQWFHRLVQDPKHLMGRYLRCNFGFLWKISLQLSGLRDFPQAKTDSQLRIDRSTVPGG